MADSKRKVMGEMEWIRLIEKTQVSKKDMDRLVMNYFVVEGYKDAAEQFAIESNTDLDTDLGSIGDRMAIRSAVQTGQVDKAIERVNDLNPEILETNPSLFFHLQQQRLIELIREGKVKDALDFVQEELPPLCEDSPQFLEELESTLALLAFDTTPSQATNDNSGPPPALAHLLHPSHRQKTASELNAAILTSQAREKESKLPVLLKMLVWAQDQLAVHASCPFIQPQDLRTARVHFPVVSETTDDLPALSVNSDQRVSRWTASRDMEADVGNVSGDDDPRF